jgi:hypothetical protein
MFGQFIGLVGSRVASRDSIEGCVRGCELTTTAVSAWQQAAIGVIVTVTSAPPEMKKKAKKRL